MTGKIAVVQRGGLNFGTKAENASKAGAAACIIYDNVNGAIINAALESFFIPTVTVTKIAGAKLAAASEKKVSFSKENYGLVDNPIGGGVSSFSSKGPAPDLTIKPEISAPGGNILSSVLGAADAYEVYSGTSMATPHMAGEAALLRQYLEKNYPNITGEDLGDLVNSLLMSTAVPSVEPDGTYYPSAARAQALPTSQTPSSPAHTSPSRAASARRPRSAPARTASTPTPRPSTT